MAQPPQTTQQVPVINGGAGPCSLDLTVTTSDGKKQDALDLGAHEVVISRNAAEMSAHAGSFDLIVNSVAAKHNLDPFLNLLRGLFFALVIRCSLQ